MGRKKTDLEAVKKVATTFLYLEPERNDLIPFVIHHPFFSSEFVAVKNGKNGIELVNILQDEDGLRQAREMVKEQLSTARTVNQVSTLINKPYKLVFLKNINEYLSKEDLGGYLSAFWVLVEFPNHDVNVTPRQIMRWLRQSDKNTLMSDEERAVVNGLPDKITVYRGVDVRGNKNPKGLSWTLSIDTARFFAKRWNQGGFVYMAEVNKEDVLAYFATRNESEVIIDIDKLKDIQLVETIEKA